MPNYFHKKNPYQDIDEDVIYLAKREHRQSRYYILERFGIELSVWMILSIPENANLVINEEENVIKKKHGKFWNYQEM